MKQLLLKWVVLGLKTEIIKLRAKTGSHHRNSTISYLDIGFLRTIKGADPWGMHCRFCYIQLVIH